jgi:7-carboxy-7-deazaguanine synthase
MFGKNEIIGQKYFADAQDKNKEDKLFITSIFYTLQGEGPYSGRPAVFIRFAKCNLACSFCDTFFDDGDWLGIEDIQAQIDVILNGKNPTKIGIVITGGEPMLQKNISKLCEAFIDKHAFVQIETNGTVYQDLPSLVTLVVSPKCNEKNNVPTQYLKPHKHNLERANCLKFVITSDENSVYHTVPNWAFEFERNIYISPMNVYNWNMYNRISQKSKTIAERSTIDEVVSFWEPGLLNMAMNQQNHEYAAKYCLEHHLILSLQTHLYAGIA